MGQENKWKPPEDRMYTIFDRPIEKAIAKIPAATRLYPDVYAWKIADAVVSALDAYEQKAQALRHMTTVGNKYTTDAEKEALARAVQRRKDEAKLKKIEEILARSSEVCDTYSEEDVISCGWKSDLLEIRSVMNDDS